MIIGWDNEFTVGTQWKMSEHCKTQQTVIDLTKQYCIMSCKTE
jgi:hypothetical protein